MPDNPMTLALHLSEDIERQRRTTTTRMRRATLVARAALSGIVLHAEIRGCVTTEDIERAQAALADVEAALAFDELPIVDDSAGVMIRTEV